MRIYIIDKMWKNYVPGKSPPRTVPVSKELYDAVKRFSEGKKCCMQFTFDSGLIILWREWNGDTETIKAKNHIKEMEIRNILMDNSPPGRIEREKRGSRFVPTSYIRIRFDKHLDKPFKWMGYLEELRMIHSTNDGIRRILTYFLSGGDYNKL